MATPILVWLGFGTFVAALLAFDLGVLHRKARPIAVREALWLSLFYLALALTFAAGVFRLRGAADGYAWLAGYLIEKSLSVDNIFVFVLLFGYFAVPAAYQHRVLFWGILGALVLRGALIALGAELLERFHWVAFLFGGFLVFTGAKMLVMANAEPDVGNNLIIRFLKGRLRLTGDYVGGRFFVRRDGLVYATPLFLVLVLVEVTDLVFAVDSIPAVFAVSSDPFIVYTANVFAILGLRALYFALAGVVHRFHYLKYGLSLVLLLIGGKMIANAAYGEKAVPTEWALLATALLVSGSIALSLLRPVAERRPAGWIPGSPARPPDEA